MTEPQKQRLRELVKTLVGKPYRYGAEPEEAPEVFDCSSFTQYLFKQVGITLPRDSIAQGGDAEGKEIEPNARMDNLETGDLFFMRGTQGHYNDTLFPGRAMFIGHVGMYLDDSKAVHASSAQGGVVIQDLSEITAKPGYAIVLVKRF